MGKRLGINKEDFAFLAPMLVIKRQHLTKKDTLNIKRSLAMKMGTLSFIISVVLMVLNSAFILRSAIASGYNMIEVYGLPALIGQILCFVGGLVCVILQMISIGADKYEKRAMFTRVACNILFASALADFLLCLYSDAMSGFLTSSEAISPAILFLVLLVLIQPAFWKDMAILDSLTTVSLVVVALVIRFQLGIEAIFYYIVAALIFPLAAHLVVGTLFYAETQNYCQRLINERLNDTVRYDELTHCKSRVALRQFLEENVWRWTEQKRKILIIMFDIDNFKEYNDQFSHLGGDHCLRVVSDAIRSAFPMPNLDFFRYGGEEFLLFFELEEDDDPAWIIEKARRSVKGIKLTAPNGAPKEIVTISLGGKIIAVNDQFSFEDELKTVDGYLYKAKSVGKDASVLDGTVLVH